MSHQTSPQAWVFPSFSIFTIQDLTPSSNPPTTTIEACNRTRQRILDATAKLDAKRQEPQQIKAESPRPAPSASTACVMCRNAWDNQCKQGGYDGTDFCAELIKSNCAQDCRTF